MTTKNQIPSTARQFRLLICGSRKATSAMLATAYKAVERARERGWAVLVGDNPEGVDKAVVQACLATGIQFLCVGIADKPRNPDVPKDRYWKYDSQDEYDYTGRDRYMADFADRALCIWNGESRGTIAVHRYMQGKGRQTDLMVFRREQPQGKKPQAPVAKTEPKPESKPESKRLATVEVLIDTVGAVGMFALRALDASNKELYHARQSVTLSTSKADCARIETLLAALKRLQAKAGDKADYSLRIVQSSNNVEGWLGKAWKRNTGDVQKLAGEFDQICKVFPEIYWNKQSGQEVRKRIGALSA